jgi:UDPglucose 6-dehydrogenase
LSAPSVAYAGLTHLGLVSAAAAAEKGFRVIAFDPDAALVKSLAGGRLPVEEPGLEAAYRNRRDRFAFVSSPEALAAADLVFISADVPTDNLGRSSLAHTRRLIELASAKLKADGVLVVLCQVPPGFTRSLRLPEERLFYQVETLVFGQALARALEPERFIVGCDEPTRELPATYHAFLAAFGCPVLRMGYESAELSKIAINCFLVASVSAANTLAELCEKIGADWSEITPALRLDRRIGPHAYLSPGLGIAGGNLERDLATVIRLAGEHDTDSGVVRAWVENSRHRRGWAARALRDIVLSKNPQASVAVWGLAYKENTHSTKNSPSLATMAEFPSTRFRTHDPVLESKDGPLAAARGADALMILTPWPQYREVPPADIARVMKGRVVLDPFRVLDRGAAHKAGLELYTLGRAPNA